MHHHHHHHRCLIPLHLQIKTETTSSRTLQAVMPLVAATRGSPMPIKIHNCKQPPHCTQPINSWNNESTQSSVGSSQSTRSETPRRQLYPERSESTGPRPSPPQTNSALPHSNLDGSMRDRMVGDGGFSQLGQNIRARSDHEDYSFLSPSPSPSVAAPFPALLHRRLPGPGAAI
jgi:hypothetical protein